MSKTTGNSVSSAIQISFSLLQSFRPPAHVVFKMRVSSAIQISFSLHQSFRPPAHVVFKMRRKLTARAISFDWRLFAGGNISQLLCKHRRMKPSSVARAAHVAATDVAVVALGASGGRDVKLSRYLSLTWQRQLLRYALKVIIPRGDLLYSDGTGAIFRKAFEVLKKHTKKPGSSVLNKAKFPPPTVTFQQAFDLPTRVVLC